SAQVANNYNQILPDANTPFEEGTHTESRILEADIAVKSPGIPATAPIVQKLKEQQTPVIAEIEFAAQYTNAKLIGITGSNGKSTTTMLTWHMLKQGGLNVGLAGNIGRSF